MFRLLYQFILRTLFATKRYDFFNRSSWKDKILNQYTGLTENIKGQRMIQNGKQFCLSHSVSQEAYIILLLFLAHMCKMMLSLAIFFIFSKFRFGFYREDKIAKKWP